MIELAPKHWTAIVKYFRAEERILRDSYGIPGRKKAWFKEYRRMQPNGAALYEKARDAIKSHKN